VRRFLHQLCVLQSIDEFELFTLHFSHVRLILRLLFSLARHLLLQLLPGAILALHHVEFALLGSLLLLRIDHVLHVSGSVLLLAPLLLVPLPNGFFLRLRLHRGLLLALHRRHLALHDSFICHLLAHQVILALPLLVHLVLAEALLFNLLNIDVPLPLGDDLAGSLTRFINLPHDFALFHLEQADTVAEEFKVLLCSLPRHLGCAELFVQRGVIILLVRRQVHLVKLSTTVVVDHLIAVIHHLVLLLLLILPLLLKVVILLVEILFRHIGQKLRNKTN